MRLASPNGNLVELTIAGYQFAANTGSGYRDWDANWLDVQASVVDGERAWSFTDPCLTTWEARSLAAWLHAVADGSVEAAPVDTERDLGGLLIFTEPVVAFGLHERSPGVVTLRVYLSLEARPEEVDSEMFDYFVELTLTDEDLAAAARAWESEIDAFPVRP